jgi:hypothetical protein
MAIHNNDDSRYCNIWMLLLSIATCRGYEVNPGPLWIVILEARVLNRLYSHDTCIDGIIGDNCAAAYQSPR